MRRLGLLVLVLGWTTAAFGPPERDRPRNLVANGAFQQAAEGGGPEGWSTAGNTRVQQRLRLVRGRAGGRSAELTCTAFPADPGPDDHAMLQQSGRIAIAAGRWYRISFWARSAGIVGPIVTVALVDMQGWQPAGLYEQLAPGERWERFEYEFRSPIDLEAERSRLQFWFTSTGTLWVDDVLLEASAEGPVWSPRISSQRVKNLVPNSSFECGGAGWGSLTGIAPGSELSGGELYRLEGEIDPSMARHGGRSLRIALGPGTSPVQWFDHYDPARREIRRVLAANRGWFEVVPGAPLTLSAFLRADAEGTAAQLVIIQPYAGILRREAKVGTDWRRESFTFTPTDRFLFLAIGLDLEASGRDRGALWLDSVQLERGSEATAYEPRQPLEAFLEPAGGRAILDAGEEPVLTLQAFNDAAGRESVSGSLEVLDFFDRPILVRSLKLGVPPRSGASTSVPIALGGRQGFFRATWKSASGSGSLRLAAIVPARPGEPGEFPFGFNHSYAWDFLVGLARKAGIVSWRDWSAKWQTVEPEKGVWDFSAIDRMDDRLRALGGRMHTLIPFPSAAWSSSATREELSTLAEGGRDESRAAAAFAPRDAGDLAGYAAALLRRDLGRHAGSPSSYEILNEPLVTSGALPSGRGYTIVDYLRLLRAVSASIKHEDPRAVVVGGLGAGPGHPLTKAFVAGGGMELVDVLDLHVYSPPRPPEGDEESFRTLEDLMRSSGGSKPVWITEWGCYADDDPPARPLQVGDRTMNLARWPSERAATEQIVKFTAVSFAHGVRRIYFHAGSNGRINGPDAAGVLFEYGGAPRKMLPGVAALSRLLGVPSRFLRTVSSGAVRGYLFQKGEQVVAIVWAGSPGGSSVALREGVRAHDIMGNEIRSRRFTATTTPIYLVAPIGRADDVARTIAGGAVAPAPPHP